MLGDVQLSLPILITHEVREQYGTGSQYAKNKSDVENGMQEKAIQFVKQGAEIYKSEFNRQDIS